MFFFHCLFVYVFFSVYCYLFGDADAVIATGAYAILRSIRLYIRIELVILTLY